MKRVPNEHPNERLSLMDPPPSMCISGRASNTNAGDRPTGCTTRGPGWTEASMWSLDSCPLAFEELVLEEQFYTHV
ncbi:Porimin [Manis pentadactyla]|nr:Porimin [Manis pentadactyla]